MKNLSSTLGEVLGLKAVKAMEAYAESTLTDAERKAAKRKAWDAKLGSMLAMPGLVARVAKDARPCAECDHVRAFLSQPGKPWSDESPVSAVQGRLLPKDLPAGFGALVSKQHAYSHLKDVE